MACPSSSTCPSTRGLPDVTSCMRLRVRKSVDLPHPDGPMMAVTRCGTMDKLMARIALCSPYQALTLRTSSPFPVRPRLSRALGRPTGPGGWVRSAVALSTLASLGSPAGEHAESADQRDQHEGAAPGFGMPVVVRRDHVVVDLDRQGSHRLEQVEAEELVAERRQEQWGGLSARAGQRQDYSGDDARPRGRQ